MRKWLILLVVLGLMSIIGYRVTSKYCNNYENDLAYRAFIVARSYCRTDSCVDSVIDSYYKIRENHVCGKLGLY